MGARVDDHNMCAVGERAAAGDGQVAAVFVEDGEPVAFRRDVEPVRAGVVGQHVWVTADPMLVNDLPAVEIHGQEHRVAVAGDERQPGRRVEDQTVVAVAAGQRDPPDDRQRHPVDDREDVGALHVDEHLPGGRVVGDVTDLPTEGDAATQRAGVGVEDGLRPARLSRSWLQIVWCTGS